MALPELQESNKGSSSLYIRQGPSPDEPSIDWYHEWKDRNTIYMRFGHIDEKHILEFPGLSLFSVSLNKFLPINGLTKIILRNLLNFMVIVITQNI